MWCLQSNSAVKFVEKSRRRFYFGKKLLIPIRMDPYRMFQSLVVLVFSWIKLQVQEFILLLLPMRGDWVQQDPHIAAPTVHCVSLPPRKTRSQWMNVRSRDWWETVVLLEFTNRGWKQNFRMTRQSFVKLCSLMQEYMAPEDVTVRVPVPLAMRLDVVLHKLGVQNAGFWQINLESASFADH